MSRYAAIAARFLLFHVLSVLVTAIIVIYSVRALVRHEGAALPLLWPSVEFGLRATQTFGPVLLVPSALGWWFGGQISDNWGLRPARRRVWQGLVAGLFSFIAISILFAPVPPTLLGLPIGAFFGWLIYRRVWPDPPAPAQP